MSPWRFLTTVATLSSFGSCVVVISKIPGMQRNEFRGPWHVAMIRLNTDPPTQLYAARRRADGKTEREVLRCLKRHAREIYRALTDPRPVIEVRDLRPARHNLGLAMRVTADQLGVS